MTHEISNIFNRLKRKNSTQHSQNKMQNHKNFQQAKKAMKSKRPDIVVIIAFS
jgi:hypothetical protein